MILRDAIKEIISKGESDPEVEEEEEELVAYPEEGELLVIC